MKFEIEKQYIDTRLDKYIRRKYKLNINEIFKLISNGKIQVNFKKQRANYRLKEKDIIYIKESLKLEEKELLSLNSQEIKKLEASIVYENENILIYNKEADMVMHKGSGHEYGLSEMFQAYYENVDFTFVNRIDRETSGLIIGSKNLSTTREISRLISEGEVIKKYYIIVEGMVKEDFEVKSYLIKKDGKMEEYKERVEGSKESISYFNVISSSESFTMLEALLGTGRTHQLRVQLSKKSHPIVGDKKYGSKIDTKMNLFSHRIVIEKYNIDINLQIPEWFTKV